MPGKMKTLLACMIIFLNPSGLFAQVNTGSAKGVVRDSVRNFVMQAATISIYKVSTGELISYQLSNNLGRFLFKELPVDVPLHAIATNIGYAPLKREFMIPRETNEIDLNTLNMDRLAVSLKEVIISAPTPPVQMRGDTLEFNADAFKLDSNAVVEDMLKKLPGITIWNDGAITVNGKKITQLLVDGKVFFDTKGKIALQNLLKNSVKKIQVYEEKNEQDPVETKTNMNIVLKKDKKDGYFGKIGGSLGTMNRYDGNGMLSYFSPKDQISVVGAINNVNKTADNINTLVQINSFKGQGISNDYHSDFTKPGAIVFKATGFNAFHDFDKINDTRIDTNNLNVAYFMTASNAGVNEHLNTEIFSGQNNHLSQTTINSSKSSYRGKAASVEYNKKFDHSKLYASYNLLHNTSDRIYIRNTSSGNSLADQSRSYDEQNNKNSTTVHAGKIRFKSDRYMDYGSHNNRSVDMELSYEFRQDHSDDENKRITDFTATDGTQNKHFDRNYIISSTSSEHNVISSFNNIQNYFHRTIDPALQIDVKNALMYYTKKQTDAVSDFSNPLNKYVQNNELSNYINTRVMDYRPGLDFSKSIVNRLSNRYRKAWNFDIFAEGQLYDFKNNSQQHFQNLNRSYFYFIPSSSIGYSNNQLGKFRKVYLLKYNTSVGYPTLQQMAPLVDDANVYFLNYGNIALEPSYTHDLSFRYDYNNAEAKNPFQGDMSISIGATNNFITDSTYYDALGRTMYYPINVSGERHASLAGALQKAFKNNDYQFQLAGKSRFNYSRNPLSLNGKFYEAKRYSFSVDANLTYTYKGLITQIGETFFNNRTSRNTISDYKYSNWKTYANISFTSAQGLLFNSRVDFNKSASSNTNNIYYTIWNIDLGYRFLKGDNGEVKISGLDLLHQNKNVFNNVNNNSITTGTVNVLQQYFMVTLAYYPRKFGLNRRNDNR